MANTADKVLLDANILIELVLQRAKYKAAADTVIEHAAAGNDMVTSILSADLLLYYVEKEKRSKADAFRFLEYYKILDMNEADYRWAIANDQGDFEDALQVACALRHGCSKLLTLDKTMAAHHAKHLTTILVR